MDTSRSPLYYRNSGISPRKSPTAENVQKRRQDIEKSERAAYWALFNTSVATLLYYDLYYVRALEDFTIGLIYLEWIVCGLFATSAFYDFCIHFWPHTFMKPIIITPQDKRLLGIKEEEFGFKVVEQAQPVKEQVYDSLPAFEIHHSFEEDEKIVTPSKRNSFSPDTSLNISRRSKVVDKESLVEYLKNCQILEEQGLDNNYDMKSHHSMFTTPNQQSPYRTQFNQSYHSNSSSFLHSSF